jgi:hypothetical protein
VIHQDHIDDFTPCDTCEECLTCHPHTRHDYEDDEGEPDNYPRDAQERMMEARRYK